MLTSLKKALNRDKVNNAVMEKALASTGDTDVKDMFLDDIDSYLDGAEDDPDMEKLLDEIPEYDEDDIDDEDLEALDDVAESMLSKIPQTILTEEYSVYHGLLLGNGQFADDLYDTVDDQRENPDPNGDDEFLKNHQSTDPNPATTSNIIYNDEDSIKTIVDSSN